LTRSASPKQENITTFSPHDKVSLVNFVSTTTVFQDPSIAHNRTLL